MVTIYNLSKERVKSTSFRNLIRQVIAFSLVSVLVAFAWTNFSAYPSETDFGSTANSDNKILLMMGNDLTSVSGSASVSIVPGSSSPNNG